VSNRYSLESGRSSYVNFNNLRDGKRPFAGCRSWQIRCPTHTLTMGFGNNVFGGDNACNGSGLTKNEFVQDEPATHGGIAK
jgi:hypothetical protein